MWKTLLVGIVLLLVIGGAVGAGVEAEWEWKGNERVITYSFELAPADITALNKDTTLSDVKVLNKTWQGWVDDAAKAWNTEKTGWTFKKVNNGGMLRFASGKWTDGTLGQIFRSGTRCNNGLEIWTSATIVMNTSSETGG